MSGKSYPGRKKIGSKLVSEKISYPSVTGGVFLPFLGLTAPLFYRFACGAAGSEEVEVPVFEVPVSARLRDATCLPEVAGRALGAEPPGLVDAGAGEQRRCDERQLPLAFRDHHHLTNLGWKLGLEAYPG